jgi:hypothetical protein
MLGDALPDETSRQQFSENTCCPSAFTPSPRDCGMTAFGSFATLLLGVA